MLRHLLLNIIIITIIIVITVSVQQLTYLNVQHTLNVIKIEHVKRTLYLNINTLTDNHN